MILIILATISINVVLGEDGLIKRSEKAGQMHANGVASEQDAIDELLHQVGVATGEIIENPYDKDGWKYAWVCTNGVWDNTKYEAGVDIPEGEGIVVAKIYETGKKITPPDLVDGETTISFTEGNEYVMVIEGKGEMGVLMDEVVGYAWQRETISFLEGESETCTIPYVSKAMICDEITNISDVAFAYASMLTKIMISNSVTNIGVEVFVGCTKLKEVTIPNSVTSIGEGAFVECTSLININIPKGVTTIKDETFLVCTSLKNITIPDSVTSIGSNTFGSCTSLRNITIPNSVTSIGEYAFSYCTNLTTVDYLGTQAQWNAITIGTSNEPLTSATINYLGEDGE